MNGYMHRDTGLIVHLEADPSGMIVAYVPMLPGCVSQGESEPEALENIHDAIQGVVAVKKQDRIHGGLAVSVGVWSAIEHVDRTRVA